jgi:gluconokinase
VDRDASPPPVVVLMGISGAGKSAVGQRLAASLGWTFVDADDLHSPQAVKRMARGVALTEADRGPWLERVADALDRRRSPVVLACSALRRQHRRRLRRGRGRVVFVHLQGDPELIARRLRARRGHFFDPGLLQSQLQTLEPPEPEEAVIVKVAQPLQAVVDEIQERLKMALERGERHGQ